MSKQNILEQYKRMGKNFMTPEVKEYQLTTDNRLLELSTGTDIEGKKIWGVTEFHIEDGKLQTTKRGQMHRSAESARRHFNSLI